MMETYDLGRVTHARNPTDMHGEISEPSKLCFPEGLAYSKALWRQKCDPRGWFPSRAINILTACIISHRSIVSLHGFLDMIGIALVWHSCDWVGESHASRVKRLEEDLLTFL